MEAINELFTRYGINLEQLIVLSGFVLLIVNLIKQKLDPVGVVISGGWTQGLAFVVSFAVNFFFYNQNAGPLNWTAIIISTLICWFGPDSFNSYVNRKVSKIKL